MSKTQTEMVLEMLRSGPVTPMDALRELGCYRLGARIFNLRQQGHNIKTTPITNTNRFGAKVTYAQYTLEPDSVGINAPLV